MEGKTKDLNRKSVKKVQPKSVKKVQPKSVKKVQPKSVKKVQRKSVKKVQRKSVKKARINNPKSPAVNKMFSESDIRSLLANLPSHSDIRDRAIIEKRLRNFVYDPSYESQFFTHNEKRSIEDSTYLQALARIGEYSKGYLEANEI